MRTKIITTMTTTSVMIDTFRQAQREKGRKRSMMAREREARTKPKRPFPSIFLLFIMIIFLVAFVVGVVVAAGHALAQLLLPEI